MDQKRPGSVQRIFKRQEKKYLLTRQQAEKIEKDLEEFMEKDAYGESTVCSLYFDNDAHELIMKSIDKPFYKEKFRLRSYGVPRTDTPVFAEIKKKVDGVVYKRRVTAPYQQVMDFLDLGRELPGDRQIQREIRYMIDRYRLHPSLDLAYDRIAYAGREDPEVRITFDYHLRYRTDRLNLAAGDGGEALQDDDFYIMETKLPGSAPLWLAHLLSKNQITPGTFSKYGTVYQERLLPGRMAAS